LASWEEEEEEGGREEEVVLYLHPLLPLPPLFISGENGLW